MKTYSAAKDSCLVYSTSGGNLCPGCGKPLRKCSCKREEKPLEGGPVRISYSTQGRHGKGVTLIEGLPLDNRGLLDAAKDLKRRFATGGSVKGRVIELQGDFRLQAEQEMRQRGFVK
jgi:translation initiation factor 1